MSFYNNFLLLLSLNVLPTIFFPKLIVQQLPNCKLDNKHESDVLDLVTRI